MNNLLQLAVNAHGGIDRWNKPTWVDTDLSMTGAIWVGEGQARRVPRGPSDREAAHPNT